MKVFWYFGFFLVSGFCGLVYEIVWLRLAMAKFGVTTPMVSIVLSVFMAGLALGSWGGGALARRLEHRGAKTPLRLYGLIEVFIGVSGLLVPRLLHLGYEFLQGGGSEMAWDSSFYYFMSGGCVALSLLPWCICMGATFPLAMAAIRKSGNGKSQQSFSYLYLANVLGAILGTVIPAFFLIELLGFQGTLRVASSLNGVLAATVFALSWGRFSSAGAEAATPIAEARAPRKLYDFSEGNTLWLLFLTGLCTMAMEIVWIRQYTVYLGNVVYSFAVILALYLGATCVGSSLYRFWVRSHDPRQSAGAWLFLGLLALLPLAFADPSLPVPRGLAWTLFRTAAGIVPISGALGFLTPLLVDHFSLGDPNRAGRAYAVNIIGAIIGPLLGGFLILPWLGDHWGLVALYIPLFGIGLLTVARKTPDVAVGRVVWGGRALYFVVILLSIGLMATAKGYETYFPDRVELRDYMATVIATQIGSEKILLVNGAGMTILTPATKYMAHLPLAFLDRQPQSGLVICFGMGTTFRSILSWGIQSTAVELVPSVPKLFGYYHPDGPELMKSPLANIRIDDGRRFLERSSETYDVITLDPPPPISTATTSLLFFREFYEVVKRRLRSGGILQVWLAVRDDGWDPSTQSAVAKALMESFSHIRVIQSLHGIGLHFLASDEPLPSRDARELANRLPPTAVADLVEWGPHQNAEAMFREVLQKEQPLQSVAAVAPHVPAMQDDRPINEYFLLRRISSYFR